MQKLTQKLFIFYLSLTLLLNTAFAIQPESEPNIDNPIPELYVEVTPEYMKSVLGNVTSLLDSFVFADILKNPPYPYNDTKLDVNSIFKGIKTDTNRPFYEFYRDFKKNLSVLRDTNFDVLGGDVPIGVPNGTINFKDYRFCLPFKFLLLYEDLVEKRDLDIYIVPHDPCWNMTNETMQELIDSKENIPVTAINGMDPYKYVQTFGAEFYKFKNPESNFNIILDSMHDNKLVFTPISIEQLNNMNLEFKDGSTLETKYILIKEKKQDNETEKDLSSEEHWDHASKEGEVKCREDKENQLNVLFFNSFYVEGYNEEDTISCCAKLIHSNDYKTVIITQQLWEGDNYPAYYYTQLLFPKIAVKFNMAMKQSELNKEFYESNPENFLEAKTCRAFKDWNDFIEAEPDKYGDVEHKRTKIYNPFSMEKINKINEERLSKLGLGHSKRATDVLILTDTVAYGAASNFMKTIQINGGAIIASYGGNPKVNKDTIKTLDASLDPADITNYENMTINNALKKMGFDIYSVPFAESFEMIENNTYPMAFVVNEVDEKTDIYHYYQDTFIDEYINKAKVIFEKYNAKCNPENSNLVFESNACVFSDDPYAHGGYQCGEEGSWDFTKYKKTYCDYGYFYNKLTDQCEKDECVASEIIEINEEVVEKPYKIEPNKRYIVNLNTNLYTYFFKSTVDDIIEFYDNTECSKFCVVSRNNGYMFINYNLNLKENTTIYITSKKINLYVQSMKVSSPEFSRIISVPGKTFASVQLTEDNYLYIDSYDKSARFFCAKYEEQMTADDIININENYFVEVSNEFIYLPGNNVYIGIFVQNEWAMAKIYMYNSLPGKIDIADGDKSLLFLENNKEYYLDFSKNTIPVMIRLNEKTNATFKIVDNETESEESIDFSNKYFIPKSQLFNGTLKISNIDSTGEDEHIKGALIEILYLFENAEIIDNEVNDQIINNSVTLIEYSPEEKKKTIQIFLESKGDYYLYVYGGLSKVNYSYSYYSPKQSIHITNPIYAIKLEDQLKNLDFDEEKEKYYITLITPYPQNIKVSVKYYSNPLDDLYEIVEESYINNVISNLSTLIEKYYVFYEIAQNPPAPYNHTPIELKEALENINTTNRTFYDFYRDLRTVIATPHDFHFMSLGFKTPGGFRFDYMTACLPFTAYVEQKEGDPNPKLYIEYFPECAIYFSEEIRNFVKEMEKNEIAIEKINGGDPFEFIQNFGKPYVSIKSPHAHFSAAKSRFYAFPLSYVPYNADELKMEFKFEGREPKNIDYYIYLPNFREMNGLLGTSVLSQEEFDEFYESERKKHYQDFNKPNIFEMIKKYKKKKGILLEDEKSNEGITWDFQTPEENGIKCRYDKTNELNVLVQESFSLNLLSAAEVIYNCTKLFYNNNHSIVVIENNNGGGRGDLSIFLRQLLQAKIQNRVFVAYKATDILKTVYNNNPEEFYNVETGRPFLNYDDFMDGTPINYSTPDKEIIHNKSKMTDFLPKESRIRLEKIRKELLDLNPKKPTEIIIFTDSYSFSATSVFIKAMQNEGGAITVGFNGNPTFNDSFDASQSPSPVYDFSSTKEYENLKSLGIIIEGITFGETFEEDYNRGNPIPREYKYDPVDERSNIYDAYWDEDYGDFIKEANRIFKKYNEDNKCNPNNKNLVLEEEGKCQSFVGDEHARGGYLCGPNGEWDTNCNKSYCDIGYYYSKLEDKCIRDIVTNDPNIEEIILNDTYNDEIIISKNNNKEYVLRIDTQEYIYFFEASKPGFMHYTLNNECPSSICVLQMNRPNHQNLIHINYLRNATDEVKIKITSKKGFSGVIQSFLFSNQKQRDIQGIPDKVKVILIAESTVDYVYYFKTFNDSSGLYFAEYNQNMTIDDILEINETHFKPLKNEIYEQQPGKIYIFAFKSETPNIFLEILLQPKEEKDINIQISDKPEDIIMYFSNLTDNYTLDFSKNKYGRMIHLSKASLNSNVTIKDLGTGQEKELNLNNQYYSFNNPSFTGKLVISVKEGNGALLEFLFFKNDLEIVDERNIVGHQLSRPIVIKFDKNSADKNMIIMKSHSGNNISYSILMYYSNSDYYTIYPEDIPPIIVGQNYNELIIYNQKEELVEGESYCVIIYIDRNVLAGDITISKIDYNILPIYELYHEVTPVYMADVISNIKVLMNSYVFSDIMKNPPKPYDDSDVDLIEAFNNITINKKRPFYEFYRDIKIALGKSRDANMEILGSEVPLGNEIINFKNYAICLPFRFYVDYNDTKPKVFIEENPDCSKYYDEKEKSYINEHKNKPLLTINNTEPFEFIDNYAKAFYNMKNKNSQYNNVIDYIHYNELVYQPSSPEHINYIKIQFNDTDYLETKFHIYNKANIPEENDTTILEENDFWNITSNGTEIKCRVDEAKKLNVLFINSFYLEERGSWTINKCTNMFYENNYKIVIITSQLWFNDDIDSYIYTQLLFPKIDVKFNMAMKQTELNQELFEKDKSLSFLDAKTCSPFESWEAFKEPNSDNYGDVKHHRTKIFNPIPMEKINECNAEREYVLKRGYNRTATDILILTDTVAFGAGSNFIKTVQNNGGAIIASYGGNPNLSEEEIKKLDASLDPAFVTSYVNTKESKALKEEGFDVYIPYAEGFVKREGDEYPMAFVVNGVDEVTDIIHSYDDKYYNEFIDAANKIFENYTENCNPDNKNLLLEVDCSFEDNDTYAHGGYQCGDDGKWDNSTCNKSYCDFGYYYDITKRKCVYDYCSHVDKYPLIELYQEVTPDYMQNVIKNIKTLMDSYVFSDILKNPPKPYDNSKVDLIEAFNAIPTNEKRPFYEFYRDIKITLGKSRDASMEILGKKVLLGDEIINFEDYQICLPFRFYIDYNINNQSKIFIEEFTDCSKYYDESVITFINEHKNKPLVLINGTNPLDFVYEYASEFYNMKNRNGQFANILNFIHYNDLVNQPLSLEQINHFTIEFENEKLNTHFHIIKEVKKEDGKKDADEEDDKPGSFKDFDENKNIIWNYTSKEEYLKCRVDETKKLNVLFIQSLYVEEEGSITINKCKNMFNKNNYKIVIITSQLWEGDFINSYIYTQLLFPKIDVKFNMAMKQTELNKELFENDKNDKSLSFLDAKICQPFESWEEFKEPNPDRYDSIEHHRTKIFNPIPKEIITKYNAEREDVLNKGYNRTATDILILTDSVLFGEVSNFIKTVQNNGGAIIASYGGKPGKTPDEIKKLDASLDPSLTTSYKISNIYQELEEKGFDIYIPYAEGFAGMEGNKYPMAFIVNGVDEVTNIIHSYDDKYYEEFIEAAKNILDKYVNSCNPNNEYLVFGDNCTFEDDEFAHGGYQCGNNGKWDKNTCKKSYCDIGYYYDVVSKKCLFDYCTENEFSPLSELYQEVTPDYMNNVITNVKTLMNSYVFSDILKNPPDPYDDSKVDLIEAFNNITINTKRPFYEFYRDIKIALGKSRDASMEILGKEVPLGNEKINFEDYQICLPFRFYVDKDNSEQPKIFIEEFTDCSKYYDESEITIINNHKNKPLVSINGTKPFEYIYEYASEFYNMKNRNGQFANILNFLHYNNLVNQPLSLEQINHFTIEFENNEKLDTKFHIIKKEKNDKSKSFKNIDEANNKIWNYTSKEGYLKCRVDDKKQLNVLFIQSLYVEETGTSTIKACTDLFNQNYYKIVIITSQLWEGDKMNSYIYNQLLFPKIDVRFNMAMKQTELNQELFENDRSLSFLNVDTCLPFDNWEEFKEQNPDRYDSIEHHRTKIFNPIPDRKIKELNDIRNNTLNNGYNRTATDILILTDSVLFGEVSNFIKTVQNNGGAIIASYGGKPGKTPDEIKKLDASLDPSLTTSYKISNEYKELEEKGFDIYIPYAEGFANEKNDTYPMAFLVNAVDEVTNIIHSYDDKYYDEFIEAASNIFENYKENCNSNNTNLLLEADCTLEDNDTYAHGGYQCGDDGKWDKSTCKKSYCDIGYYYDRVEEKCIADICTNDPDTVQIELNGEKNETITITKEKKYIYKITTNKYLYFFKTNVPGVMHYDYNNPCPSNLCVLQKDVPNHENEVYININKKATQDITLTIESVKDFKGYILSTTEEIKRIQSNPEKLILISEAKDDDFIYFFRAFDDTTKAVYAEYKTAMTVDDIITANVEYFKEYELNKFNKRDNNTIHIFIATTKNPGALLQMLVQAKTGETKKTITITNDNEENIMYFSKGVEYTLDFKNNDIRRIFKLSRTTFKSEITITYSGKNYKLDSNHSYFNEIQINKEKLQLKVTQEEGAAIEFLYAPNNYRILYEKEFTNIEVDRQPIIKFNENTKYKHINITISSKNGNNFGYSCLTYYSKDDFAFSPKDIEPSFSGSNSYLLPIYYDKDDLEEGETFNLIIYIEKEFLSDIKISKQQEPDTKEIILDGEYKETIIINKTNNTEYIFKINTEEYLYFFKSNQPGYMHYKSEKNPCPSYLCSLQKGVPNNDEIHLNIDKDPKQEVTITIESVKDFKGYILSSTKGMQMIQSNPEKLILISEPKEDDFIYYFKAFDDSTNGVYAEYKTEMTVSDITSANNKYFNEYELNKFNKYSKDKIHIFIATTKNPGALLQILVQTKEGERERTITNDNGENIMYFAKGVDYTLDFKNNNKDRIIKLSKTISESEIEISYLQTKTTLNSTNSYFTFDNANSIIFRDKLTLKVTKGEEAAIEFLYSASDTYQILNEKEFTDVDLVKSPIIKFDNNTKNKNINITMSSKSGENFSYSFSTYYSKDNYMLSPDPINPSVSGSNSYTLKIYNKDEKLEEGESFNLIIYINQEAINKGIKISKKEIEEDKKTDDGDKDDGKLEGWEIALIVVGCVLFVLIVLFLVWKFVIAKNRIDSEQIGSLVDHNAPSGTNEMGDTVE